MKKLIFCVMVIAGILLTSCGPSPVKFYNDKLLPLLIEFQNQEKQAISTARGSLSPVIIQLVATSTKIQVIAVSNEAPECMQAGLDMIVGGTSLVISGAQEFSTFDSSLSAHEQDVHDSDAATIWDSGMFAINNGITTLKNDCKLK